MPKKGTEIVDVEITVIYSTDKAWLVKSHITAKEAWIPRSVGEMDYDSIPYTITMPRKWAEDKELV